MDEIEKEDGQLSIELSEKNSSRHILQFGSYQSLGN